MHDCPPSQHSDDVSEGGYGELLPREFFSHLLNKDETGAIDDCSRNVPWAQPINIQEARAG